MSALTKRQEEFLQAAINLVGREGFSKLTIRNIAEEVGLKEGSVYRHFPSKFELLKALLHNLEEKLTPQFDKLYAQELDSIKRLEAFITGIFSEFEKNPTFASLVFSEEIFHLEAGLLEELQRISSEKIDKLSRFFAGLQEDHRCRTDIEPRELAMVTLGTIKLTITRIRINPEGSDLKDFASGLIQTLNRLFSLQ
jgi:AcrR family transcriptional regulator